jgi:hypothetical protein
VSKIHKFVAFGDNHGDLIDGSVSKELLKFLKWYRADSVVHLGDNYDMRSIRRGASGKEENESLADDIKAGTEFIKRIGEYNLNAFLYGNHEDRLSQIINNNSNGLIVDYCQDLDNSIKNTLKSVGCRKIYDYHADTGVHSIGPVKFVHGYTCGTRAVEEHAIHYADRGGALIMGHLHSIQQTNAKKHGGAVGFSGGCLCRKEDMGYSKNRLATSKWGHGWLYGFVQGSDWKVWQAHKVGKDFIYSVEGL